MKLKILSPDKLECEAEVQSVTLPGALGSFTVLKNHAALISNLVKGTITYKLEDGKEQNIDIDGGVADVMNNVIRVCIS